MQTRAPAMVGRDGELDRLETALAGARNGCGGAAFVVGEPGIGKTRMAVEVAGRAFTTGMLVLRGRASTIGPTVPFRPLSEALLSLFRIEEPPAEQDLGPYRPALGRLIPEWSTGEGGSENTSIVILAEAVLRLIAVLGRDRGCLVVLEDLHDADPETLAVVEYLADNLDGQPALLLATARNEASPVYDLAQLAAQRYSGMLLELERLERAEVRGLVAACLETAPGGVPAEVVDRLAADSAGNPFLVEELLHGLVSNGLLAQGPAGWQVIGQIRTDVPGTLVRSISRRTDRLSPQGRMLLSAAAVLGHRFPLSVVQKVTGMDDRSLLSHLHAGMAAQLVTADEPAPDWYAFQHPLTADALLTLLTPADRAELARKAADAVQDLHPELSGEWCQLVASLRMQAGDRAGAARVFAEAGRRALAAGAAGSSIALLERAESLLSGDTDPRLRADVFESLLYSLAEAGRLERAFELITTLDELGGAGLDPPRRAGLHVRLAWVAHVAGRREDADAHVYAARELLGADAADEHAAPLDAVAAHLALNAPSSDRKQEAESLARRAVAAAERAPLPAVACQAWLVIGAVARGRDLAESTACYETVRLLAEEHRLPIWRIHALVWLGGNRWLADGGTAALRHARQEARRVGAFTQMHIVDATLVLDTVLRGDYPAAAEMHDRCWASAHRLRIDDVARHLLLSRAALAAHQGKRPQMEQALLEFRRMAGDRSQEQPMVLGMARAFCALLEEDRDRAAIELARALASEDTKPTTYSLVGRHGLDLLLKVLRGTAGWPQYEQTCAAPAGTMRWNRQFVSLAKAVLHGRSGQEEAALAAVADAQDAAAPYAMARHLGLRLVAEAAHADGWGEPETWLRQAEEYFHHADVPAVASACRGLLRQVGASVQQRRSGVDRVPDPLRRLTVTVREFEVFELLADRLGNKAIAGRLRISPRTVEKHVASLIAKTAQPDRMSLSEFASTVMRQ
ncbi:AAA family ATPase [Actinocrispum sp. NPDC049592]|uniref:ATP-binding protein n=1 Tax=Actinocrispum sp. NPDC049592 TaxID=3154835 RepID=UPI003420892F